MKQSNIDEEWRDIPNHDGLYSISNKGRVRSNIHVGKSHGTVFYKKKKKILRPTIKPNGYMKVTLYHNGQFKNFYIQRLVAEAFIPNPLHLPQANHKDENKVNNCVENLEWCTAKYNHLYGTYLKRMSKTKTNGKRSFIVGQYTLDGKLLRTFPSIREAGRVLNKPSQPIQRSCHIERYTAFGYK